VKKVKPGIRLASEYNCLVSRFERIEKKERDTKRHKNIERLKNSNLV
jgi:hypothetical protein